jgi:DNA-binding Lrp family transcriptional regulator
MLDALDRKLLALLQQDARRTNADLAAEVGLSVSACAKRTARYWADGLIAHTPAVLDHRRFRRPVTAIVTITLVTPTADMSQRFSSEIMIFDEVQQCHAVTGDYDFLLLVRERSIEDYHAFAQRTFGSNRSVRAYKTTFVLQTFKSRNSLPEFCLAEAET